MTGDPHHDRDDMASPVDLPADEDDGGYAARAGGLGWASGAIAVATAFLFLFNANALHGWAAELPPNAVTARIVTAAAQWEAVTDRFGLGAPRAWLRAGWKAAEDARFGAVA